MTDSPAISGRHPAHAVLAGFPIAYWLAALLADVAYVKSYNIMWVVAGEWLIFLGLIFAGFAALFGLIDWWRNRAARDQRATWIHLGGTLLAFVLSIFNELIHARDGADAVIPAGMTLSILVVLIVVAAGWWGGVLAHRQQLQGAR